MFYKQEDVDQAIICGICHSVYKNPRLLPCSESACHECIQFMIQTDPNHEFVCNFCHEKHTPGKDGFLLNGTLMKLLKAKAGSVYRNEQVARLKEKLDEIKSKSDEFKLSLENGVDQVKKHCIQLRNQVDLETERLMEEAHSFNESLIMEINKYEVECIKSFQSNSIKNDDKFIVELDKFYSDKTKYLNEFNIDEKQVEKAVAKADSHLEQLKIKDASLKYTIFNGQEAEFVKRQYRIDRTLLGKLVYKSLGSDVTSFNELKLSNTIDRNLHETLANNSLGLDFTHLNEFKFTNEIIERKLSSRVNLFKNNDGYNFAFLIDANRYLKMTCFDKDGQVINQVTNALTYGGGACFSQIHQLFVAQSFNNFIFYVVLPGNAEVADICGNEIYNEQGIEGLFFILDQDFNYIKHNASYHGKELLYMTANSSKVICIDSCYNYYLLDMDFVSVNGMLLQSKLQISIQNQIGNTVIDVQMSDRRVFFLCSDKKLKIFEINSGNLVKEIEISANQIKLAPNNRLVLFDSLSRIVYLYEQTLKFDKLDEVNLAQILKADLKINRDQSNCLAFYNTEHMKYTLLNSIFEFAQ
jgi:hypothetical protein